MTANPRGRARMGLATALVLVAVFTLLGCDGSRTQVLLKRGTPAATPTSARLAAPSATPWTTPSTAPLAITPLVASPSPTPEETRPATATAATQPSATPAAPTRTVAPTMAPATPTVAPTSTPRAVATATPQARVHIVRAGETLAIIARRYATTATAIARYNGLSNPNRIYVGQRLLIP
jgi:LysM repeat protein